MRKTQTQATRVDIHYTDDRQGIYGVVMQSGREVSRSAVFPAATPFREVQYAARATSSVDAATAAAAAVEAMPTIPSDPAAKGMLAARAEAQARVRAASSMSSTEIYWTEMDTEAVERIAVHGKTAAVRRCAVSVLCSRAYLMGCEATHARAAAVKS